MKPSVILIGAGNVGEHLGKRLHELNYPVLQVYSRSIERAGHLTDAIHSDSVNRIDEVRADADIYILAVSDAAIQQVSESLKQLDSQAIIVHTSGATDLASIHHRFENAGIFYPIQTFSSGVELDYKSIPVIIQARSLTGKAVLIKMGADLFGKTVEMNDSERAALHLAAVFVNNFANHMLALGEDIMEKEGIDPQLLNPLIQETFRKAIANKAGIVQTGPALRNDQPTIQKHLARLKKYPEWAELYKLLTKSIKDFHIERTKDGG